MPEFKSFSEIKRYKNGIFCILTEKVHGSNAQILIENDTIIAGSRTRWLSPGKETDNYGFAQWVEDNKVELIEKLGNGRHYGEWYGQGINSGYNLKEKRFALFNTQQFPPERPLPNGVDLVPVLYQGPYSDEVVKSTMNYLKTSGSKISTGFMKPEGIVIYFPEFGHRIKSVFMPEETAWRPLPGSKDKVKQIMQTIDITQFLQPIRLEKLLSRDSNLFENYPTSLPEIFRGYLEDMEKEDQFLGVDDVTKKALRKSLYPWVRSLLDEKTISCSDRGYTLQPEEPGTSE